MSTKKDQNPKDQNKKEKSIKDHKKENSNQKLLGRS